MAKFLTTHNVASEIDNIIRNAHSWLVLVSPYLKLSPIFLERLQDVGSNNIPITIIFGKNELKQEELQAIGTIKNLTLLFYENMHAKCYCNQDSVVITSMNMHEFSEKNNREMGVLLQRLIDSEAYAESYQEIQSILRASSLKPLTFQSKPTQPMQPYPPAHYKPPATHPYHYQESMPNKSLLGSVISNAFNSLMGTEGYCIQCRNRISFNPDRPLCSDCFSSWNNFKNPKFVEEFCHSCGKTMRSTMEKPLCKPCYSKR